MFYPCCKSFLGCSSSSLDDSSEKYALLSLFFLVFLLQTSSSDSISFLFVVLGLARSSINGASLCGDALELLLDVEGLVGCLVAVAVEVVVVVADGRGRRAFDIRVFVFTVV